MKKILTALLLAAILTGLCACAGMPVEPTTESTAAAPSGTTEAETTATASTEPETTTAETTEEPKAVLSQTYSAARLYHDEFGTLWVQVIAEVQNSGRTPVALGDGTVRLYGNGEQELTVLDHVAPYPQTLKPGERAVYYEEKAIDTQYEGDLTLRLDCSSEPVDEAARYTVSDTELRRSASGSGIRSLTGTVQNETSRPGELVCVAAVLYDAEKKPLGVLYYYLLEKLQPGASQSFTLEPYRLPDTVRYSDVESFAVYAYPVD